MSKIVLSLLSLSLLYDSHSDGNYVAEATSMDCMTLYVTTFLCRVIFSTSVVTLMKVVLVVVV